MCGEFEYDKRADYDDEEYEARIEARREEAEDKFDAVAVACANCGERYDPKMVRATRTNPAYVQVDTCPNCGSDEVEEK